MIYLGETIHRMFETTRRFQNEKKEWSPQIMLKMISSHHFLENIECLAVLSCFESNYAPVITNFDLLTTDIISLSWIYIRICAIAVMNSFGHRTLYRLE